MAKQLPRDTLWERTGPLFPPERPKPKGGRPHIPDRAALTGSCLSSKPDVLGTPSP